MTANPLDRLKEMREEIRRSLEISPSAKDLAVPLLSKSERAERLKLLAEIEESIRRFEELGGS